MLKMLIIVLIKSFLVLSLSLNAQAADRINLSVELSQSVLPARQSNKAHLQIKLQGLHYEETLSRPPVNVALVIDRSGSMAGAKIEQAKQAAILALSRLSAQDRVSVIAFDHKVDVIVPSGPFQNFDEMRRRIEKLAPGGQTAIYSSVRQAAQSVSEATGPDVISRIILLSDGQANVGPSSPVELEKLGREIGSQGIAVTTIGLGLNYNEDLMTRLALASDGNHAFVENPEQLADIFNKELGDVFAVVGQDVEIELLCPDGVTPKRALGRQVEIDGRRLKFRFNQIGGAQERYLIAELDVAKTLSENVADLGKVTLAYIDPKTKTRQELSREVKVRFTTSGDEAAKSINPSVTASVATQLAIEQSERAVGFRDKGLAAEAQRELEQNAAILNQQADRLEAVSPKAAAPLRSMAEKNLADSKALTEGDWDRTRKSMREQQYKSKNQQRY